MRRSRKAFEDRIRRIEAAFPGPPARLMERTIEEDADGHILRVTVREHGTKGRPLLVIGPEELSAGVPIPGSSPHDGRTWLTVHVINTRPKAAKSDLGTNAPKLSEAELLDEIEKLKARKAALIKAAKGKKS